MPKVLTETAVFTATVTVPEGTDSRNTAAEDVEAIAQVLADRSRALKAVTDVAARTNVINNFTPDQQFTTIHASGLIQSSATIQGSELVSTHDVHANNDVTAGDDVVATGSVIGTVSVEGPIISTTDILLPSNKRIIYSGGPGPFPNRRDKVIPMSDGIAFDPATVSYNTARWQGVSGLVCPVAFPVLLPNTAIVVGFVVNHLQVVTPTVFIWRKRVLDFTTGGVAPVVTDIETHNDAAAPASINTAVDGHGEVIANDVTEYVLICNLVPTNELYGLRVQFLDPGPRSE